MSRSGSCRKLRPQEFIGQVDQMYATARELIIADGHVVQVLALIDCRGKQRMLVNQGATPFSHRPDKVRALIRKYHACAGITIAEAWLAWTTQGRDPQIDAMAASDRPDREEVLVVSGTWPLFGINHLRVARILRPADGVVDLVELDISGAMSAAGLPADGALSGSSWLSELLPDY